MEDKQREENLKGGRKVQVLNVIYDVIEVVVSLTAGFTAGSAALIGWGLDSIVEVLSATTLWWRLHGELEGIGEERVKYREKVTLFVMAEVIQRLSVKNTLIYLLNVRQAIYVLIFKHNKNKKSIKINYGS